MLFFTLWKNQVIPYKPRKESKDTTHFSIIDKDGNAVSNTYTLGLSFGSGVTIPGTGILMNSQMNNFAYRYGDKTDIGRGASPGNKFEPGKKPMSTMAPTIIFDKEDKLFPLLRCYFFNSSHRFVPNLGIKTYE